MTRLIIPVGIPGCGKSTFCKTLFDAQWVSSDAIRTRITPDGYDPTKNGLVFAEFHATIEAGLVDGYNVVADATNLEARARYTLYGIADRYGATKHVLLFTNIKQAIQRNAARPVDGGRGNEPVGPDIMRDKMVPRYEDTLNCIVTEPFTTLTRIESVNHWGLLDLKESS